MTLTQQWWQLSLARNSSFILFHAKVIVSYWQLIPTRLYVRF